MASSIQIFIAYARKDAEYLNELKKHLAPLERNKIITVWCDKDIEAGAKWAQSIKTALHNADIILLLVSADAIASDYFYHQELPKALEREHNQAAKVIPIIVRPCVWNLTLPRNIQVLPRGEKPISTWDNHDSAYIEIVSYINQLIPDIERKKTAKEKAEKERIEQEKLKAEKAAQLKAIQKELEKAQKAVEDNKKRMTQIDETIKTLQRENSERQSKRYELDRIVHDLQSKVRGVRRIFNNVKK